MTRKLITRRFQRIVIATLVVGYCLGTPVSAAELSVAGFTNGCLSQTMCVPDDSSASQTASLGGPAGLLFLNASFSGTTAGGTLALNGAPVFPSPGAQNLDNLGSFALGTETFNYGGDSFVLRTSFSSPSSITDVLLTAQLSGVVSGSLGSVLIDFPNTPVPIASPDGTSFTLTVNDVTVVANGTEQAITGRINVVSMPNNPVPEPSALALLAVGAVVLVRRFIRPTRDDLR